MMGGGVSSKLETADMEESRSHDGIRLICSNEA